MHGAAVYFAEEIIKHRIQPKMILCTDMTYMIILRSLIERHLTDCTFTLYFHENQLSYPWSPTDRDVNLNRDVHYGFINYSSALAADRLYFNSKYHRTSFINSCDRMLSRFPDFQMRTSVDVIRDKSSVLYLGLQLDSLLSNKSISGEKNIRRPVLVWNHRWEFDKNPEEFFNALIQLKNKGLDFSLVVLGESFANSPEIFKIAEKELADRIIHYGFTSSKEKYFNLLAQSDIVAVTSIQDFFGGSVIEAMAAGCIPLLPARLAFPEHIPEALKNIFLYRESEKFVIRLEQCIKSYKELLKHRSTLKKHISRYDWNEIAKKYDIVLT